MKQWNTKSMTHGPLWHEQRLLLCQRIETFPTIRESLKRVKLGEGNFPMDGLREPGKRNRSGTVRIPESAECAEKRRKEEWEKEYEVIDAWRLRVTVWFTLGMRIPAILRPGRQTLFHRGSVRSKNQAHPDYGTRIRRRYGESRSQSGESLL